MNHRIDVSRYLRRIGVAATPSVSLQALRAIVCAHAQAIPFENLSPFSGRPVALDLAALQLKIIDSGRGGYCFEQNLLLRDVLQQIGFRVTGLAARVMWNAPPAVVPRTHMVLAVDWGEDTHLVDVGFGGLTLTGVLKLQLDVAQSTPHEPFRLVKEADDFVLQARLREEWRPLYRFDLQPQFAVDYEPVNWYLSTHPESRFVKNLIAARTTPDRRYALLNRELATHHLNGPTEKRTLSDVEELRRVLTETFLIEMPSGQDIEHALMRAMG